jgi:hypothetical protein
LEKQKSGGNESRGIPNLGKAGNILNTGKNWFKKILAKF